MDAANGRSRRVYGPPAYLNDVRGLIEHLGTRVILVGHSMGGAVAQWVAVTHPDLLEALIIVDAPHGPPPLFRRLMWRWRRRSHGGVRPELRSADDIIKKFRLQPPETNLTRLEIERLALHGAEQLPNGAWAFRFDPETRAWRKHGARMTRPKIRKIKMPTLLLRGDKSGLVGPRHVAAMHRKIKGSVLKEIPRAFHHVPLDNPARYGGSDYRIRREAVVEKCRRQAFGEMPRRRSRTFFHGQDSTARQ